MHKTKSILISLGHAFSLGSRDFPSSLIGVLVVVGNSGQVCGSGARLNRFISSADLPRGLTTNASEMQQRERRPRQQGRRLPDSGECPGRDWA
jgi:hypothetical protein